MYVRNDHFVLSFFIFFTPYFTVSDLPNFSVQSLVTMSNGPSGPKYPPYYSPTTQQPPYSSHPSAHQHMAHPSQQPPNSPIPIDPALSLYNTQHSQQYYSFHPSPNSMGPPPAAASGSHSSPSSHSETVPTPPADASFTASSSTHGKRPSTSGSVAVPGGSRKRARVEDEHEGEEPDTGNEKGDEPKAKSTRGSRYVYLLSHVPSRSTNRTAGLAWSAGVSK